MIMHWYVVYDNIIPTDQHAYIPLFVGDFGLDGRLRSSRAGPGLPARWWKKIIWGLSMCHWVARKPFNPNLPTTSTCFFQLLRVNVMHSVLIGRFGYRETVLRNIPDLCLNRKPDVGEEGSCGMASSPPSNPNDSIRSRTVTSPRGASNWPWFASIKGKRYRVYC